MSSSWRTIRVFISSTFRDMHSERDWLVKQVFPALRERLEPYQVHLVDIDLRWGVTREQSENNQVLEFCLQQIEECRPFFIGILGERYGWVPDEFSKTIPASLRWISEYSNTSVTELEIVHGVLRESGMQGHAFFYFRDPQFIGEVPAGKRELFLSESDDAALKQQRLKDRIRASGLPVIENYTCRYAGLRIDRRLVQLEVGEERAQFLADGLAVNGIITAEQYEAMSEDQRTIVDEFGIAYLCDLEQWGRCVESQLWAAFRSELDLPDGLPSFSVDPLEDEEAYHERFIESRLRLQVDRPDAIAAVDNLIETATALPRLLTGSPGLGKSSLLACVAQRSVETGTNVIAHFVGASPASTSLRSTLGRICSRLAGVAEQPLPDVQRPPTELGQLFADIASLVPITRPTLIIIDAIDQFDDAERPADLSWLPEQLPSHVKLLMSCADEASANDRPVDDESLPLEKRVERLRRMSKETYAKLDFARGFAMSERAMQLEFSREVSPAEVAEIERLIATPTTRQSLLRRLRQMGVMEVSLGALTDHERKEIVRRIPLLSAKALDADQCASLLANPASDNPLFLLVALEELRGFGSYEQLNSRIASLPRGEGAVRELFDQVIERLEVDFDRNLVEVVLSSLVAARRGLSQSELEQIVFDLPQRERLFPMLRQLRSFIISRGPLFSFIHDALRESARCRYMPTLAERRVGHERLIRLFENQPDWLAGQDLAEPKMPNRRRVDELAWHLLIAKRSGTNSGHHHHVLSKLLLSYSFLEAKVAAGMAFDLADEFARFTTHYDEGFGNVDSKVIVFQSVRPYEPHALVGEALRADLHFIVTHPDALLQCLWNRCWWYDCEQVRDHYDPKEPSTDIAWKKYGAHYEHKGEKLSQVLSQWHREKQMLRPDSPWVMSLRPPARHLGNAQWSVLPGPRVPVNCVAYGPGNRLVASGADDGTLCVWNAITGEPIFQRRRSVGRICCIAFTDSGHELVTVSANGAIATWDVMSGRQSMLLKATVGVRCAAASMGGQHLILGFADGRLELWKVGANGKLVWSDTVNERAINGVAIAGCGRRIAAAIDDGTVAVWDVDGASVTLRVTHHEHQGAAQCVAFAPDSQFLCSGGDDQTIRVWNVERNEDLSVLQGHSQSVTGLAVSTVPYILGYNPTDPVFCWPIASGSVDASIRLWDVEGRRGLGYSTNWYIDHNTTTGEQKILNRYAGAKLTGELTALEEHGPGAICLAFSPDGANLVSGSEDHTTRIWIDMKTAVAKLRDHTKPIREMTFTPDGTRLITHSDDMTVRVWDSVSGTEVSRFESSSPLTKAAISPDGEVAATVASDGSIYLLDAQTGCELLRIDGRAEALDLAFSPSSERVACLDLERRIRVWNVRDGAKLSSLKGAKSSVDRIRFETDDILVVGGSASRAHAWNIVENVSVSAPGHSVLPPPAVQLRIEGEETFIQSADGRVGAFFPDRLSPAAISTNGTIAACAASDGGRHLHILQLIHTRFDLPLTPKPERNAEAMKVRYDRLSNLYRATIHRLRDDKIASERLAFYFESFADICSGSEHYDEAETLYQQAAATWDRASHPLDRCLGVTSLWKLSLMQRKNNKPLDSIDSGLRAIVAAEGQNMPVTIGIFRTRIKQAIQGLDDAYLDRLIAGTRSGLRFEQMVQMQTPQQPAPAATAAPSPSVPTALPKRPIKFFEVIVRRLLGAGVGAICIFGGLYLTVNWSYGWLIGIPLVLLGVILLILLVALVAGIYAVVPCPRCGGNTLRYGNSSQIQCQKCGSVDFSP